MTNFAETLAQGQNQLADTICTIWQAKQLARENGTDMQESAICKVVRQLERCNTELARLSREYGANWQEWPGFPPPYSKDWPGFATVEALQEMYERLGKQGQWKEYALLGKDFREKVYAIRRLSH